MKARKILRERLEQAFRESDYDRVDLAARAGVSTQAVYKWLKTGKINVDNLPIIADFFDRSIDWFFGREKPNAVPPSRDEREWLDIYRSMGPKEKTAVRHLFSRLRPVSYDKVG